MQGSHLSRNSLPNPLNTVRGPGRGPRCRWRFGPKIAVPPPISFPPSTLGVRRKGSHELPRSLLHRLGHTGDRRACPYARSGPITPRHPTLTHTLRRLLSPPYQCLHRRPEPRDPRIHPCERQAGHLGLIQAHPEARTRGPHCGAARLGSSTRTLHLFRVHAAPTSHA